MPTFAERAGPLVAAAAQIARLKGVSLEATVLEKARASLVATGYDNWNGGTDLHTLMLEVPIPTYAAVEDHREELERSIRDRVALLVRKEVGNSITEVVISPVLPETARPVDDTISQSDEGTDLPTFWQPGFFRLFISHASAKKASAHRLKEALAAFRVTAFVAHDDIEPTKEWQAEIERALRTMDSLLAIVTAEFVASRWCDQEVGIAIGRNKLVLPLCAGADPHGFMGKHQGIRVNGLDVNVIAAKVVDALVQNSLSAPRMADALIERLATSNSWQTTKRSMAILEKVPRLNASQVAQLVRTLEENPEVSNAAQVPDKIKSLIARIGETA